MGAGFFFVSVALGAPGVFSARYAVNDEERIERILRELDGFSNRKAHFVAALCFSSPDTRYFVEVEGRCEGEIATSPRGDAGFGYDPIFVELETGLTFAEMTKEMKQKYGHRGKAFSLLRPHLLELMNS